MLFRSEQVVEIRELVRGLRGARTVLFSSHILSEVQALCERVVVIARGMLVGEGRAVDLARRLGGRQRVTVRADGPTDRVQRALEGLGGVEHVAAADGAFVVEATAEGGALAHRVGHAMLAGGWAVQELRQEALGLEDIFLELVRPGGRA